MDTKLDIGLSKEDLDRIESLHKVGTVKDQGAFAWLIEKLKSVTIETSSVRLRDKVTFYQLLAVMINAGVRIIHSVYVLAEQTPNKKFRSILQNLGKGMEGGRKLSEVMEEYPNIFSVAERGMIASGEASGQLDKILKDIAKQVEKNAFISSRVKGALIYPVAVFLIMGVSLFIMLTMVIPKIGALFTEGGQTLPWTTRTLMALSEFAQNYWQMIIIGVALALLAFSSFRKSRRGQYLLDSWLLRLPIFGKIVRNLMLSRFAYMVASLMNAGLPIVKALEINANAIGNEVYKRRILFASQDVAQGIPLGENLKEDEFLFPPMVASMVMVGEQTANLTEVAQKVGSYYEDQVDLAISSLSKIMEPVILVVMGLIVGFIVAAVMQPILALSDLSSVL